MVALVVKAVVAKIAAAPVPQEAVRQMVAALVVKAVVAKITVVPVP